ENRAEICEAELVADAYVFSRDVAGRLPWRPDSSATGRFAKLRKKVGLETVRLHDLRHYVATRLPAGGVPVRAVSERLGHATATTTLATYAHAVPATDRRAALVMGDLLHEGRSQDRPPPTPHRRTPPRARRPADLGR